jgi:hypothetical protein
MDQRGATLIEVLISSLVGSMILLGIGSFYVSMLISYNQGSAQVSVQRQGTLIQEHLARQILPAISVPPWGCGPEGVPASERIAVQRDSDFLCFYLQTETVFECDIVPGSNPGENPPACSDTPRDLLNGSPIPIRADSLTFNRSAGGSSVDIIFALTEEELNSRIVVEPVRFALGVRLRNR